MRDHTAVIEDIVNVVSREGRAQVPGYVPFKFSGLAGHAIVLTRRNGNEVMVPYATLEKAISAVRTDQTVYLGGPNRLREFSITHINSPTWSLIRLLPFNKLID